MRPEKQLLLNEIKEKINASKALFFVRYDRLEPNACYQFRLDLLGIGGDLEVVRKRVLIKAFQAGKSAPLPVLDGHIAIVFAYQDPLQTSKMLYQFKLANEGVVHLVGGHFEGRLCTAQDVQQIATLPSRDEMRAQLLATLEAPPAQLLAVMELLIAHEAFISKDSQS